MLAKYDVKSLIEISYKISTLWLFDLEKNDWPSLDKCLITSNSTGILEYLLR